MFIASAPEYIFLLLSILQGIQGPLKIKSNNKCGVIPIWLKKNDFPNFLWL